MLHPLFSTIIHRPGLLVDHLTAYGALVRQEALSAGSELVIRLVAWVSVAIAGIIFFLFAGIAVMLGFINEHFHWALVIVPGVPLAVAIGAFAIANKPVHSDRFPVLKAQIKKDAEALHAVI